MFIAATPGWVLVAVTSGICTDTIVFLKKLQIHEKAFYLMN